jgi:hypothetical protein
MINDFAPILEKTLAEKRVLGKSGEEALVDNDFF